MTELNATGYLYNSVNYSTEFKRLLWKISICYSMMIDEDVELPPNDENEIRNRLLFDYLKNDEVRKSIGLQDYLFDREVPEDKTEGRTDIKIQTHNTFLQQEAYYIIECKRLDNQNPTGVSGLNAEYVKNGIYRFVSKQYSTYCRVNGMIGFVVEAMNIHSNTNHINMLLHSQFEICNTTKNIQKESFIPDFEFHYSSTHNDCDNNELVLYHLMFDFSACIKV